MTSHVLVVSRDSMLLQTRQLIIGAFFQVHGAGRVCEVEALTARYAFDLIVLCFTLSDYECNAVREIAVGLKRPPRVLVLAPMGSSPEEAPRGDASMAEAGPYYLLKKCAEMLGVDIRAKESLVGV